MIRVFKFRANDLNPSAGKQIEFNSAVVQSFFHFTKDTEEIVCHYIDSNGREGMTIKSSLSLSPARGDYKIYQNNDGTLNLKDFFLQRLHLTLENNSNDYFALRKREGYHYDLFYLPVSLSVQEIYDRLSLKRNEVQFELFREPAIKDVKEQYRPFITAIKSKPFLLLAGISGTGKSRIVRELARACWDVGSTEFKAQKPKNFEMVQVKPNWHDSSELIGYVSRIGADKDGNGVVFVAGDFLRFVAKAWENPEIPYFLCLDEMNLAPVEQYFAEFLSAIESRSIENGEYETDPIIKPFVEFDDMVCTQMIDHLVGKVDASKVVPDSIEAKLVERFKTKGLTLPKNLLVLGTVNMDETTFSFSRKVLDRAMSIVMNDVDYDKFFTGETENDMAEFDDATKKLLIDRPIRGLEAEDNGAEQVEQYLTAINEVLNDTPFKLGYRAANEALLYVSAAHQFDTSIDVNTALDEFTLMKILSRIEGDKRSIGNLLDDLQRVINDSYPASNKKLVQMAKTLQSKQFVSYWT